MRRPVAFILLAIGVLSFSRGSLSSSIADVDDVDEDVYYDDVEGDAGIARGPGVQTLTKADFDSFIASQEATLVAFTAPWCGHCQRLKPEYDRASLLLGKALPNRKIALANVDATKDSDIAERYTVRGYPTLMLFWGDAAAPGGGPGGAGGAAPDRKARPFVKFEGGRTAEEMVTWIKKQLLPPTVTIESPFDIDKLFHEGAQAVVVANLHPDSPEAAAYLSLARDPEGLTGVEFASLSDLSDAGGAASQTLSDGSEALAEALGLGPPPSLVLLRAPRRGVHVGEEEGGSWGRDELRSEFNAAVWTKEKLKSFVLAERLPLVSDWSLTAANSLFRAGMDVHVFLLGKAEDVMLQDVNGSLVSPPARAAFQEASRRFRGQATFSAVDLFHSEANVIAHEFGIESGADLAGKSDTASLPGPQVYALRVEGESALRYRMSDMPPPGPTGSDREEDWNRWTDVDVVERFVAAVLDRSAPRVYKSQPPPEEDREEGVKILVGVTFPDHVGPSSGTDTLVMVTAPWCHHCKETEPVFQQLAKRFKSVPSVLIAKMDGTMNEVQGFEVRAYPTIALFRADGAPPVRYDGAARTLKEFTQFLKTHASIPFKLPQRGAGPAPTTAESLEKGGGSAFSAEAAEHLRAQEESRASSAPDGSELRGAGREGGEQVTGKDEL